MDKFDNWLPIAHEAGHEHATQVDIVGRMVRNARVYRALEGLSASEELDQLVLLETYCEIFGCLFIEGAARWPNYLDQSWEYIKRQPAMRNADRLRSIFRRFVLTDAFFAGRRPLSAEAGKRPKHQRLGLAETMQSAERVYAVIHEDVGSFPVKWQEIEIPDVARLTSALSDAGLFEIMEDNLPIYDADLHSIDRLDEALLNGEILQDNELDPVLVLRAMATAGRKGAWRSGVAGLMSLWHSSKKRKA